jgi:uncharacterized protein
LALPQRSVFFLQLPAQDDELFEALLETLELEVEAVIGLVGRHASQYRTATIEGQQRAPVIAFSEALVARNADVTPSPATPLDYERLHDLLTAAGAVVALAELHGGVCGALCAGGTPAANRWLAGFLADAQLAEPPSSALSGDLDELVSTSASMLADDELVFEPLLPSDDAPLEEQVEALAAWCQGFLSGIGSTVEAPAGRAPASDALSEILRDFAEISRAGLSDEEADGRGGADFALAEIHEYVRVSAQIVFEELAPARAAAALDVH